jgi:hypothetical protein
MTGAQGVACWQGDVRRHRAKAAWKIHLARAFGKGWESGIGGQGGGGACTVLPREAADDALAAVLGPRLAAGHLLLFDDHKVRAAHVKVLVEQVRDGRGAGAALACASRWVRGCCRCEHHNGEGKTAC